MIDYSRMIIQDCFFCLSAYESVNFLCDVLRFLEILVARLRCVNVGVTSTLPSS